MRRIATADATAPISPAYNAAMFKWLLVFIVCSVLFSALRPWLAKLGVGNMPGDFRFRVRQTEVLIPLGSTLFFTLCFWGIGKLI